MKRIIVGFDKLSPKILNLFVERYPDGYGDNDIIEFKNGTGETIQAVELKSTDRDTKKYLIKKCEKICKVKLLGVLIDEPTILDPEIKIPLKKKMRRKK